MKYRGLNDLSQLTSRYASSVPRDVELIVGIPRSGMLVASILALKLNLPLTDLYSFLRNDDLKKGNTRTYKHDQLVKPQEARKILLVDDSVSSGKSMRAACEQVKAIYGGPVVTMAAFVERHNRDQVDLFFEQVEQPRMFEWNIMHHPFLAQACLDIDGVLCVDPTVEENDDGPGYLEFLCKTRPLFIPSVKVAHLVTSRLEKYRPETERWLQEHGVQYGQLHMLDLPTAEERRRLNIHHKFKAQVFAQEPLARLFIESEAYQAQEICRLTGKPVYCIETNEMYTQGELANLKADVLRKSHSLKRRLLNRLKTSMSRWLPESSVSRF
nr:phosphoribosyltransferase [Pseudomonas sp.]